MVLPQRYKLCWLLTNSSGRGASSDAGTGDSSNAGSKACANNADDANNGDGANTDANNAAYNNGNTPFRQWHPAQIAIVVAVRNEAPALMRLGNAGGPAGLAALEQRRAAERQAQLRHAPREVSSGFARTRNNPDEGTGGLVVIRDEGVDVLDEFGTAPEGLTIERLFGEDREPDFDLA